MWKTECFYFPSFSLYLEIRILSSDHETTSPHVAGEDQWRELQEHLEGMSSLPMSTASAYHQTFSPEMLQERSNDTLVEYVVTLARKRNTTVGKTQICPVSSSLTEESHILPV